jgi:hypothetical protein
MTVGPKIPRAETAVMTVPRIIGDAQLIAPARVASMIHAFENMRAARLTGLPPEKWSAADQVPWLQGATRLLQSVVAAELGRAPGRRILSAEELFNHCFDAALQASLRP